MAGSKVSTVKISIHAPREGGDRAVSTDSGCVLISIHAPREGGDDSSGLDYSNIIKFQSTPPARGATRPVRHVAAREA